MKKILTTIIMLLVVLSLMTGCTNQQDAVKIGVTLPLTGNLAFIGESGKNAMILAVEEFNAESDVKVELIFEDDAFTPAKAITNVNKLMNVDNVDAIVTYGSPTGMAVAPIAQENGIPHIGIATADVASFGNMNFNHWTPPKAQAEKLAERLVADETTKVSMIVLNHEGGIAMRDAVVIEFEASGIEVLAEEKFTPGETDFKTIWNKIAESEPEAVFFVAQSPEFEILLKQKIELGLDIHVVTIESPDYTDQPELFNNNWFINAAEPTEEFSNKFQEKFESTPKVFSGNAFDIVKILGEALIEDGQIVSAEEASAQMMTLENESGALGPYTTDSKGIFVTEAIVKEMVDGKSITVE